MSSPSQTVVARNITTLAVSQNLGTRSRGQIQTADSSPGTRLTNHIVCTDTSALDGGSQPTPLKKSQKSGTGASESMLAPKTRPLIPKIVITSLRNTMRDIRTERGVRETGTVRYRSSGDDR